MALLKLLKYARYSVYFLEASSYNGQNRGSVKFASQINPAKFEGAKIVLLDELFDNGNHVQVEIRWIFHLLTPYLPCMFRSYFISGGKDASRNIRTWSKRNIHLVRFTIHSKIQHKCVCAVKAILACIRFWIFCSCLFAKDKQAAYKKPDLVGFDKFPDIWLVGYGMLYLIFTIMLQLVCQHFLTSSSVFYVFDLHQGLDDNGEKRGWPHVFGLPKVGWNP